VVAEPLLKGRIVKTSDPQVNELRSLRLLLCGAPMKSINVFVVLLLLASAASAELGVDRELFEIELHPGEMTKRPLTLENLGDAPLSEVRASPVMGEVQDFVKLDDSEIDEIDPGDEEDVMITFKVPAEAKPGTYKGFVYLFDGSPPSLPILVAFEITVIEQENYGVSLNIEDAKSASMTVDPDDPAEFELLARNTGLFRDVIIINISSLPDGWSATLYDDEEVVDLPYRLPLSPTGIPHELDLEIMGNKPGKSHDMEIMATSLGDPTRNSTVKAEVNLKLEIRKYNVQLDIPEIVVVNRTYKGSIEINLNVDERILVKPVASTGIMIMPQTMWVEVGKEKEGIGEFSLIATQPGPFNLTFLLRDSSGIPLPGETAGSIALESAEFAIVTGDDLAHRAMVLSYAEGSNKSVPIFALHNGEPGKGELETLMAMPISKAIIIGNDSIVPSSVEDTLAETMAVERIYGSNVCETSWLFASFMWPEGPTEVMVVGPSDVELFGAYQEAGWRKVPLIICGSNLSEESISVLEDLMCRGLSKALIWGEVGDDLIRFLEDEGLVVEDEGLIVEDEGLIVEEVAH